MVMSSTVLGLEKDCAGKAERVQLKKSQVVGLNGLDTKTN
jgi:hypothetical protein